MKTEGQRSLNEAIDFEKVGYKNIHILLKYIFNKMDEKGYENFLYNKTIDKDIPQVIFAEELLERNESWKNYLKKHNKNYILEIWDKIVCDILTKDPVAYSKLDYSDNKLHVNIKEDRINLLTTVMIPNSICDILRFDKEGDTLNLYLGQ